MSTVSGINGARDALVLTFTSEARMTDEVVYVDFACFEDVSVEVVIIRNLSE